MMRRLLIGVAAVSLLAGAANAQSRDHDRRDWRQHQRFEHGSFIYRGHPYGRIHGPTWAPPRGWAYQRYAIGAYLPRSLLATEYVVDPYAMGLSLRPAPRGARWVRSGDDLLLVSWRTGRVIEVVPDAFY